MSKSVSPRPPHGAHTYGDHTRFFPSSEGNPHRSIIGVNVARTMMIDHRRAGQAGHVTSSKNAIFTTPAVRLNKSERDDAMRGCRWHKLYSPATCKCCHSTTTHPLAPASDSLHSCSHLFGGRDKNDHGNFRPTEYIVLLFLTIYLF